MVLFSVAFICTILTKNDSVLFPGDLLPPVRILFDYKGIKLEIKNRKICRNFVNSWRLNNILPNDEWVKKENKDGNQLVFYC